MLLGLYTNAVCVLLLLAAVGMAMVAGMPVPVWELAGLAVYTVLTGLSFFAGRRRLESIRRLGWRPTLRDLLFRLPKSTARDLRYVMARDEFRMTEAFDASATEARNILACIDLRKRMEREWLTLAPIYTAIEEWKEHEGDL